MIAALIAAASALLGVAVSTVLSHRQARTVREEARTDQRRVEALAAVTQLAAALADHRRTMWLREEARLSGDTGRYESLRTASHATRSAITGPMTAIHILTPRLIAAADTAAAAAYLLRGADDRRSLDLLREQAIDAQAAFVTAARTELGH
ncbi:protein kilB [Streptomyces sp. NPDC047023]|uniref:protein kilB n=1 Tax=Streptomyces sp. NPDC047023 TaxID=3155139 RepID=UPI003403AE8F